LADLGAGHLYKAKTHRGVLGLCFNYQGNLVAADAYFVIFVVNINNKKAEVLIPNSATTGGAPLSFFNSVAIAKDGTVYYTNNYDLCDEILGMLGGSECLNTTQS
jgi:hypothetical protein